MTRMGTLPTEHVLERKVEMEEVASKEDLAGFLVDIFFRLSESASPFLSCDLDETIPWST